MSLKRTNFGPHRASTGSMAGSAITRPITNSSNGGQKRFGGTFQSVRPLSSPKGPSGIARGNRR